MDIRPYSDLDALKRETARLRRRVDTSRRTAQRAGRLLLMAKTHSVYDIRKTIVGSKAWALACSELNTLAEHQVELRNALQQLRTDLREQPGALTTAGKLETTLGSVGDGTRELQFHMQTALRNSVPKTYTAMVTATTRQIKAVLPLTEQTVVARRTPAGSRISQVYRIEGARDWEGFVHPALFLILHSTFTGRKKTEHHLALAHAYNPRRLPAGEAVSKNELPVRLRQLLQREKLG